MFLNGLGILAVAAAVAAIEKERMATTERTGISFQSSKKEKKEEGGEEEKAIE